MRRLLVPVDGSEGCAKAAKFASDLSRDTGAEVILVHVYDLPTMSAMGLSSLAAAQVDDTRTRVAQASFERAKAAMGGVEPVAYLVEIGSPAEQIVAAAAKSGASQIIMGSRGLSPIKELLLGSVSERVLRTAPCAVTIVR
jgi:nucleotide-binding universal stress UspA family protein